MKKYFLIITLFLISTIYSQNYIANDSVTIEKNKYSTVHLSYGKSSKLKLFKVLTCDAINLDKIVTEIKDCYKNHKLEFTEFYIISIPNYTKIKPEEENIILLSFLEKIDSERMTMNLSTLLIKNLLNKQDSKWKFEYFTEQPRNSLSDIENYKTNIETSEVCEFLRK
jgi:hypothetical protein